MINIIIEGPEHSGKSNLIAIIGKHLRELGMDVHIQSEHTHNSEVMHQTANQLAEELRETPIMITGLRTFN